MLYELCLYAQEDMLVIVVHVHVTMGLTEYSYSRYKFLWTWLFLARFSLDERNVLTIDCPVSLLRAAASMMSIILTFSSNLLCIYTCSTIRTCNMWSTCYNVHAHVCTCTRVHVI